MKQLPLPLPHAPSFAAEDFLPAPSNRAALALIEAFPHWPAPLMLLTGPEGSGKSHLAAMFAQAAPATLLSGADLGALGAGAFTQPALAIDDADFCGTNEAAFFHLLNQARARETPVLMTAKRAPDLWGVATPDLLSRLRLAPIVDIAPPEPELIAAVLTKLFSDRQMSVEPSLIAYIARRLDRSLGSARALVEALDAEALAEGGKVTRAMAARWLEAAGED